MTYRMGQMRKERNIEVNNKIQINWDTLRSKYGAELIDEIREVILENIQLWDDYRNEE